MSRPPSSGVPEIGRRATARDEVGTLEKWELLAATAFRDVAAARILEPHLDALEILAQAAADAGVESVDLDAIHVDEDSTWGVFAAEGPGVRVEARQTESGEWLLTGTKPWCSLAAHVSHCLVTAHVGEERRLFAVDMRATGVRPHPGPWVARGLPEIVSAPVDFHDVRAVPIGSPGWYLTRPGFAWGGMAVAACWWGGAIGLVAPLLKAARSERADQLALVHLGRVDAALWAARAVLAEAAELIDSGSSSLVGDRMLAERVRSVVADAATLALAESDAALGPGPLVTDLAHARRVAGLHLYLRQHHALRDTARIGRERAAQTES